MTRDMKFFQAMACTYQRCPHDAPKVNNFATSRFFRIMFVSSRQIYWMSSYQPDRDNTANTFPSTEVCNSSTLGETTSRADLLPGYWHWLESYLARMVRSVLFVLATATNGIRVVIRAPQLYIHRSRCGIGMGVVQPLRLHILPNNENYHLYSQEMSACSCPNVSLQHLSHRDQQYESVNRIEGLINRRA